MAIIKLKTLKPHYNHDGVFQDTGAVYEDKDPKRAANRINKGIVEEYSAAQEKADAKEAAEKEAAEKEAAEKAAAEKAAAGKLPPAKDLG